MRVNERHSGFPGLALGGYVAGILAASSTHVGALEVRLHRAVRIGDEFELQPDAAALMHDAEAVATARPVALDLHPPKIITREAAETASAGYLGLEHHFFATCFCCGSARRAGEGLRIFPGVVDGTLLAAPWRPADHLGDAAVPTEILWSALDCPGIWAQIFASTGTGEKGVTGSMAVLQLRPVPARETALVLAWPIGRDGRKISVGSALTTEHGDHIAIARQTLVVTDRGVPLDLEVWRTAPPPADN